jgi:RNA polymerase sigma-70 factor (ECF subfamily)
VAKIRRGEPDAFDELVRRYQRRATSVAYGLLSHRDDAMEVVQDAFLRAYDRLDSLSNPERFGNWLLRIVSNLALNRRRWRALRRMPSLEIADEETHDSAPRVVAEAHGDSPLDHALGVDMREMIDRALEELPDLQRQALVLFSIEQLPQKQVAEILDCSVESVKWHVYSARQSLREKLARYL